MLLVISLGLVPKFFDVLILTKFITSNHHLPASLGGFFSFRLLLLGLLSLLFIQVPGNIPCLHLISVFFFRVQLIGFILPLLLVEPGQAGHLVGTSLGDDLPRAFADIVVLFLFLGNLVGLTIHSIL